jgi:murein peptide amidase A
MLPDNDHMLCVLRRSWLLVLMLTMGCAAAKDHRGGDPSADIRRMPELWTQCGTSVEGRPVWLHEHGTGESTILVLGSMHGDEAAGGGVVVRFAEALARDSSRTSRNRIVFVPVVNPDGVQRGTRWNANGVDVNRNFPTANWERGQRGGVARNGDRPGTEPETQLVMDLIARYRPTVIITLHAALHVVNYDGPADSLAAGMGERNGYPVSASIGYPTPGSLGTYAGVELKIPIITLELPHVDANEGWEQNREALLWVVR